MNQTNNVRYQMLTSQQKPTLQSKNIIAKHTIQIIKYARVSIANVAVAIKAILFKIFILFLIPHPEAA